MNSNVLASGDSCNLQQSESTLENIVANDSLKIIDNIDQNEDDTNKNDRQGQNLVISPTAVDDNENKLKERIAQCKNIITSLKLELNAEKVKIENESKANQSAIAPEAAPKPSFIYSDVKTSDLVEESLYTSNMFSACVDDKLNCDENLMEYEKQLQRYQNTLNMAQIEKKNAIRKHMLAKAFKLKLLEVENQCNIELLRIKQSLQCLEPLQMIAEKWKTDMNTYDLNNYELIPRYPELNIDSVSDIITNESNNKMAISTSNSNDHAFDST